jgi:hypothetical protein
MNLPTRNRTPIVALIAVVLGLLVVGGILLVGRIGVSEPSPSPTASVPGPTVTDPMATPEGAVHAFFAAFAQARRTDDPNLMRPYVTSEQSSAYLSVQGFLLGQKAANKASVLTVQQMDNVTVQLSGSTATVRLAYTEGGYDINLNNGAPLESPNVLAPRNLTVELRSVDGQWLVDSYETSPQ